MNYNVKDIRAAGLECRWTKTKTGRPIIKAKSKRGWFVIDNNMWERAKVVGIVKAFSEHTLLGDIFSINV